MADIEGDFSVPRLGEAPPSIIVGADGFTEYLLKKLPGGTGKHKYIYSYMAPLSEGSKGNVKVRCRVNGCGEHFQIVRSGTAGPVSHLHSRHLIVASSEEVEAIAQDQVRQQVAAARAKDVMKKIKYYP